MTRRDLYTLLNLFPDPYPKDHEPFAKKVQDRILDNFGDPKYQFLCDAPTEDDQGISTVVRFSRKNKEQYVMTEIEGKATGWKAFFNGDNWSIDKPAPKAKTKAKAKKKKATTKKKTTTKKKIATAKKKTATKKKKTAP